MDEKRKFSTFELNQLANSPNPDLREAAYYQMACGVIRGGFSV